MEPLYVLDYFITCKIDLHKSITDVVMFDETSNVQLSGELLKIHYTKISVIRGVEHTVSFFFNDVTKNPVVNKMITDHKAVYNSCDSCIYHKPHYIFKKTLYEFHNKNIGLFSVNYTIMYGYFIGMRRYPCMRKSLPITDSSMKFNTMSLNSKNSKVVLYVQDNKAWERIYIILKLLFPSLNVLRLVDNNTAEMNKVYRYSRMTNISIIK